MFSILKMLREAESLFTFALNAKLFFTLKRKAKERTNFCSLYSQTITSTPLLSSPITNSYKLFSCSFVSSITQKISVTAHPHTTHTLLMACLMHTKLKALVKNQKKKAPTRMPDCRTDVYKSIGNSLILLVQLMRN